MAEDNAPNEPDEITPDDLDAPEPDNEADGDARTYTGAEMDKAVRRRDKAVEEARALKAELAKLKGAKDEPSEPSEADKLRSGMVRTAGRAVLAGAGITDKKDQAMVLDALRLDGVEVDEDGEVDTDALESRIADLRRILAPAPSSNGASRPRVDTRDKGGRNSEPADPDAARYRRIMGRR